MKEAQNIDWHTIDKKGSEFEKSQRFTVLAEKRVNKALKTLALIGNLSNRNNYAYTQEQVDKIISTLRQAVDTVEQKFKREKKKFEEFRF